MNQKAAMLSGLVTRIVKESPWLKTNQPVEWFEVAHVSLAIGVAAWLHGGMMTPVFNPLPGWLRWAAAALWLIIAVVRDRAYLRKLLTTVWPVVCLFVYALMSDAWGADVHPRFIYGLAYVQVAYMLFVFYSVSARRLAASALVTVLAVDSVVMGLVTWEALQRNPGISRMLATSLDVRTALLGTDNVYGVGGYGYIYSLGAIVVLLAYYILFNRAWRWRLMFVVVVALLLLIKASYAIAIIVTFAFICGLFVTRIVRSQGRLRSAIWTITSVISVVALFEAMERGFLPVSSALSSRIAEVSSILREGGTAGTEFALRAELYGQSWQTFSKHPVAGIAANPESSSQIGAHSEWLDLLATFGLVAVLFGVFVALALREMARRFNPGARSALAVSTAYFATVGLLNPVLFADIVTTWFLFLPLVVLLAPAPSSSRPGLTIRERRERHASEERTPRVLILHHSGAIGGGTKSLVDVVDMLHDDFDIRVCAPEVPSALASWVRSKSTQFVPMTLPIPMYNHYNGGSRLASRTFVMGLVHAWWFRSEWVKFLREVDADLVILNSAVLAPMGTIIRDAGAVSLMLVRETFPPKSRSLRTRCLYRTLNQSLDGVLFLTEHDRRMAGLSSPRTGVLRDCVDDAALPRLSLFEARRELGLPTSGFMVLFVGGDSPIKGLDVVLDALLHVANPSIHVVIAGEMSGAIAAGAPARRRVLRPGAPTRFHKELARRLLDVTVANRITILGLQEDLAAAYAASDVVVVPATLPHQARPVFEAGICGLPVVVSDFAETKEIVTHGINGLVFTPRDPRALASQLDALASDDELTTQLGVRNREVTTIQHAMSLNQEVILRFIEQLLGEDTAQVSRGHGYKSGDLHKDAVLPTAREGDSE